MTIKEYVEKKGITYKQLAKMVGCSPATITNVVKYKTAVRNESVVRNLESLGIDVKAYDPYERKGFKERTNADDYLLYEKIQVAGSRVDDIYCYTLDKLNAVTEYLNRRRICYYVIAKADYWLVKYDKTIKEEEWVQ